MVVLSSATQIIDTFDSRPEALMYAVENGISPYTIEDI